VQIPINLLVILSQNTKEVWKRRGVIKAQVKAVICYCQREEQPKLSSVIPTKREELVDGHTMLTVEDLSGPSELIIKGDK